MDLATGLRYFRHQPGAASACTAHPPESPEHLEAKVQVAAAALAAEWTALVEEPGPGWEADVLAVSGSTRIALEVQWSQQTAGRYAERQAAYRAAEVHGVWFARHVPPVPSTRALRCSRSTVQSPPRTRRPRHAQSLTIQEREMPLHEAVVALLTGAVG